MRTSTIQLCGRRQSYRGVQCDEICSLCYAKEKNVPVEKEGTGEELLREWKAVVVNFEHLDELALGGYDCHRWLIS